MKKILSILTVLALLSVPVSVFAAEGEVKVSVSIGCGSGVCPVALEEVVLRDVDHDGALTVNDALYLAHESFFEGGALKGYETQNTAFGLSLVKLWGIANGGSYGYYVNNASAMSLLDPLHNGDSVTAFVYTDTAAFSDLFCYFEESSLALQVGESVSLKALCASFDASWNPVTLPMAGLELLVNGKKADAVTSQDGSVTLTFNQAGTYLVSAVSEDSQIVPPLCRVQVKAVASSAVIPESSSLPSSPVTSDSAFGIGIVFLLLAGSGAVIGARKHEK